MANTYVAGDIVVIGGTFSVSGVNTDPTTITLFIKGVNPNTYVSSFVYGSSAITRLGAGQYQLQFQIPNSGGFYYRWVGTGTVVAAGEGAFTATSNFV